MKIALPLGVSLGLLGIMIMLSLGLISALPAGTRLPVPFGLTGAADGTASATVALAILPIVALVATLGFTIASRISRRIDASPALYTGLWLLTLLILALGHGLVIRTALFTLSAARA